MTEDRVKKYRGVSIPDDLMQLVEAKVLSAKARRLGFRSPSEFVIWAIRRLLEDMGVEE